RDVNAVIGSGAGGADTPPPFGTWRGLQDIPPPRAGAVVLPLTYTYRRVLQPGCSDGAASLTPIVPALISPLGCTGQPASGATARATTRGSRPYPATASIQRLRRWARTSR